jgi:hypothetical protein
MNYNLGLGVLLALPYQGQCCRRRRRSPTPSPTPAPTVGKWDLYACLYIYIYIYAGRYMITSRGEPREKLSIHMQESQRGQTSAIATHQTHPRHAWETLSIKAMCILFQLFSANIYSQHIWESALYSVFRLIKQNFISCKFSIQTESSLDKNWIYRRNISIFNNHTLSWSCIWAEADCFAEAISGRIYTNLLPGVYGSDILKP